MATNKFFSAGRGVGRQSEQQLVDQMVIELIKAAGQDVYYLQRDIVSEDALLNEEKISEFNQHSVVEMYLENAEGYEGEGFFMSKFGVEDSRDLRLSLSRTRFTQETGLEAPREGDLLWFPVTSRLFQIDYVSSDTPFLQLSKAPVWTINASTFTYGYEDFDTGVTEVDSELDAALFKDDKFSQNDTLEKEANDNLSFDESNPFGTI